MDDVVPGDDLMQRRDREQLHLLRILHYVVGGLEIALASLSLIQVGVAIYLLQNPDLFDEAGNGGAPPAFVFMFMAVGGGLTLLIGWTIGVLTIVSGRHIGRLRHRTFSMVIAALMCLAFPFGTALGVFTLVVLSRDSVRRMYEDAASQHTPGEPDG